MQRHDASEHLASIAINIKQQTHAHTGIHEYTRDRTIVAQVQKLTLAEAQNKRLRKPAYMQRRAKTPTPTHTPHA